MADTTVWLSACAGPARAATCCLQERSATLQTPLQVQVDCRRELLQYMGEQERLHWVSTVAGEEVQVMVE